MIEIFTLSGESIDLKNIEATIELSNSLFNDGSKFLGSYSYPIEGAFTKKNKLLLGYAHSVETGVKNQDIPVYAKIGGKTFRKCSLKVAIGERSFDFNLEIDLGIVNSVMGNTTLGQIKFDTFSLGDTVPHIETWMKTAASNTNWSIIPYTFFPILNPGFSGQAIAAPAAVPEWSGDVDEPVQVVPASAEQYSLINSIRVEEDVAFFNVPSWSDTKAKYHITPFFYLAYVLDSIAKHLGFTLKGDFIQHPDVLKIVIYNVNDIFISRYDAPDYEPEEQLGLSIKADDHLPNITISDFFKTLCSYYCIRITPDIEAGELDISWKKSTFEQPVFKDWSKKLIRITKQDFEMSDGYTLTAEIDKLDSDKEQPVEKIVVGVGKDVIPIKTGTLRNNIQAMPGTDYIWEVPFDNRPGNIVDPIFKELENFKSFETFNDFPLRFLMTKGITSYDVNPVPYPKGSSIGASFSLNLESLNNFAIQPWFSRTYAAKTCKAKFLLEAADVCGIRDGDIILFKSDNGATVQAIFEKLTFTSKRESKILADVDMLILDSAALRDPNTSGVYVKVLVDGFDTVTFHEAGPVSFSPPRAVLMDSKITTADVTIRVYSDKACTIPLTSPNLFIYLKVLTKESRTQNFIDNLLDPGEKLFRVDETQEEKAIYRKIYFDDSEIVLSEQLSSSYHKYWITTDHVNRWNYLQITRELSYSIGESNDYIFVK